MKSKGKKKEGKILPKFSTIMDKLSKLEIKRQVQKGGEIIVTKAAMEKNGAIGTQTRNNGNASGAINKSKVNQSLKRYPEMSPRLFY